MAMKRPLFTAEDLEHLPDDGKRYELFDGDLIVSPAPIPKHQLTSSNCHILLAEAQKAGWGVVLAAPTEVHFNQHRVAQPDLLFISRERLSIIGEKVIQGAPDLVVEILSPGSRKADLGWKLTLYAQGGVPFYWVLDPVARTVRVHRLDQGNYIAEPMLRAGQTLACPLFPGITTDVARLFPNTSRQAGYLGRTPVTDKESSPPSDKSRFLTPLCLTGKQLLRFVILSASEELSPSVARNHHSALDLHTASQHRRTANFS